MFAELAAGNFPNRHENVWLSRGGNRHRIAWSNTALVNEAGAVEYVVATGIAISERQEAERALREQQSWLHSEQEFVNN